MAIPMEIGSSAHQEERQLVEHEQPRGFATCGRGHRRHDDADQEHRGHHRTSGGQPLELLAFDATRTPEAAYQADGARHEAQREQWQQDAQRGLEDRLRRLQGERVRQARCRRLNQLAWVQVEDDGQGEDRHP
jgi:hypothetical protein